MQVVII